MKHLAAVVLTLATSVANPATLDFNEQPPGRYPSALIAPVEGPVVIEGWLFTPTLANKWNIPDTTEQDDKPWMYTSPWLGFTGNSPATMLVNSVNGNKFDFFGFDSISIEPVVGRVVSSAGHSLDYASYKDKATSYLMNWTNLDWIRFEHDVSHFTVVGFDNLNIVPVPDCTGGAWNGPPCVVSEPWTVWLIGVGGLILFVFERRLTKRKEEQC